VPLAQVRDLLGHASITTTERYDNQRLETLQLAVTKLERGGSFSGMARPEEPSSPSVAAAQPRPENADQPRRRQTTDVDGPQARP
jgi:hypothetical protein